MTRRAAAVARNATCVQRTARGGEFLGAICVKSWKLLSTDSSRCLYVKLGLKRVEIKVKGDKYWSDYEMRGGSYAKETDAKTVQQNEPLKRSALKLLTQVCWHYTL